MVNPGSHAGRGDKNPVPRLTLVGPHSARAKDFPRRAKLAGFRARAQSLPNAINLLRSPTRYNFRPVIPFGTSWRRVMSYGANLLKNLRQVGVYAGRILKARNPQIVP